MWLIQAVTAAAVMVGVLVVIHEAGHFVVARLFGIGTPVFSIGIGPRIFGFRFWQTDFRISLLPIGGYVQMAGSDPFGDADPDLHVDPETDFMSKPVWQRLLVMLAGPAANLVLPFVLFTAVLMLGEPQLEASVGAVLPGTTAEEIGLRPGDRIVDAAGMPVANWMELMRVLDDHPSSAVDMTVDRAGAARRITWPAGSIALTPDGRVDTERMGFFQARRTPAVGVSDTSSPAWLSGLRVGDWVESVDGTPTQTYDELRAALTPTREHRLSVTRDGETMELALRPDVDWSAAPSEVHPDAWGIVPLGVFVGAVVDDSAASAAGVEAGDRLVEIDGTPIQSWSDVLGLVAATVEGTEVDAEGQLGRPLQLGLVRAGSKLTLEFRPQVIRELVVGDVNFRPVMGVQQFPGVWASGPQTIKHYGLAEAAPRAFEEGTYVLRQTLKVLGNLIMFETKPKEAIGGPVEIARTAAAAWSEGLFTFARVMGMISFSLGIVNLLPIPVLDGGQIVFYALEGVRGRPLPLILRERIQMVGVLFLAATMVMVIVMDLSRWYEG